MSVPFKDNVLTLFQSCFWPATLLFSR